MSFRLQPSLMVDLMLKRAEINRGATALIRMEGSRTILEPPENNASSSRATEKKAQVFSFGADTQTTRTHVDANSGR